MGETGVVTMWPGVAFVVTTGVFSDEPASSVVVVGSGADSVISSPASTVVSTLPEESCTLDR
jgi:hypothetical protein